MKTRICYSMLIMLLFVSCGGTPDVVMDGREVPNVYTIKSLGKPVAANFVCVLGYGQKDADGSMATQPIYLMANIPREIRRERLTGVDFQIAVFNPSEIVYQIFEEYTITYKDGTQIDGGSLAGYSFLKNREFFRKLPMDEEVEKVRYRMILRTEDGEELLRAGDFIYRIL